MIKIPLLSLEIIIQGVALGVSKFQLSPKLDGKCTVEGFNRVCGGNKT